MMEYIKLGHTGLSVSRLCIGTMTFGLQASKEESFKILDEAEAAGINFIDTANVYPIGRTSFLESGKTEIIIGEWLKGKREKFVLVTKCFGVMGPGVDDKGLSRSAIHKAIDESLKRLQTDYIDIYLAHQFDPEVNLFETVSAFNELIDSGKVKHIGISNWRTWQIMKAKGIADLNRFVPFSVVEPRYNLLFRMIEDDLIPMCVEENIGIISYNPLAGGLLTGKYKKDSEPQEGTRFGLAAQTGSLYQERYWQAAQFEVVEDYRKWCIENHLDMTTTAVKWVLQQKGISSVIIGASKATQLKSSLDAVYMDDLSDEQLKWLDQLWYRLPRRNELK